MLDSNSIACSCAFLSLFLIDLVLGQGFIDVIQKTSCKAMCFMKSFMIGEPKVGEIPLEGPINVPILIVEVLLLVSMISFLNKYKQMHSRDTINALLQKSREGLQQTNEFLDKWRTNQAPYDYTYLDEDSTVGNVMKVEVPVLCMAIIDNISGFRKQTERQDAGDTIDMSETALLSMTSIVSDEFGFQTATATTVSDSLLDEKLTEVARNMESSKKYRNTGWDGKKCKY